MSPFPLSLRFLSSTLKTIFSSTCFAIVLLTCSACSERKDADAIRRSAVASQAEASPKNNVGAPAVVIAKPEADSTPVDPEAGKVKKETTVQTDGIRRFSLMTWNLEWFFDNEVGDNYSKLAKEQTAASRARWDWKRDAVAKSLSRVQPSVVAFQEIENKRVLWYLSRALARDRDLEYHEICSEGDDVFTEQDVGFIYRSVSKADAAASAMCVIEPILVSTFGRTAAMRDDDTLAEVSKHLAVEYELSSGDETERVTIVTVHLRAKEEAVGVRTKQARTIHAWLAQKIRAGENVIVLGDFNTEEEQVPAVAGSDMYAACGLETPETNDDLIDLHARLPLKERQTHLLTNKSFDRILVSPSLLDDAAEKVDLSLEKIERFQDLSVNGTVDVPDDHWNKYWELDDANRDISDHWPIMATFQFK